MTVGFVGTGRMGAAMVGRLCGAGESVVVFNRSRDKAEAVSDRYGARVAETARDAANSGDVVLVSLADDTAVLGTYEGDAGLLAGIRDGAVVCDTSTVDPETMRQLAPLVAARGATLLDTPVSGSVPLVERGELTVMVGGDAGALQRVQPVLQHFAARIFHLGDTGAGATMKLVVNAAVHALNVAVSEALVLAEKAGLDRTATYDVIEVSAAGAPYVKYKRAAFLQPDDTSVAFSLDLVAKDQELIDRLAAHVGARMPQGAANRDLVAKAIAAGLGDHDLSALAQFLR